MSCRCVDLLALLDAGVDTAPVSACVLSLREPARLVTASLLHCATAAASRCHSDSSRSLRLRVTMARRCEPALHCTALHCATAPLSQALTHRSLTLHSLWMQLQTRRPRTPPAASAATPQPPPHSRRPAMSDSDSDWDVDEDEVQADASPVVVTPAAATSASPVAAAAAASPTAAAASPSSAPPSVLLALPIQLSLKDHPALAAGIPAGITLLYDSAKNVITLLAYDQHKRSHHCASTALRCRRSQLTGDACSRSR